MNRTVRTIKLAVCLLLVLVGSVRAEQPPASDSNDNVKGAVPDPMTLLREYEKTLVPYQSLKITWVNRFARLGEDEKPLWQDNIHTWTLIRDGDRARLLLLIARKSNQQNSSKKYNDESIWEKGKAYVSVSPPTSCSRSEGTEVPHVSYDPCVSDEKILRWLHFAPVSLGIIHDTWIPDFLRQSTLSAEPGTLDGHAVDVLRGVSGKIEISLWLDPALGYVPRKITYDNRNSTLIEPTVSVVYEVKRFEQKDGRQVPVETFETKHCGERAKVVTVVKSANGKNVIERTPIKDKDGKVTMAPASTSFTETKLVSIQLDPKLTDKNFQISIPIPDGTKVINHEEYAPHVTFEWNQGKVVKVVEPAIAGKFDPVVDASTLISEKCKAARWISENILVFFGTNSSPRCADLEETIQSNAKTLWPLFDSYHRYAYRIVFADLNNPANRALAKKYGIALDGQDPFCLTVLSPDGHVLCNQDLAALQQEGKCCPEKLVQFLKQWEPKRKNAAEMLDAALHQAADEEKNLFVVFSGRRCGPCRRLTNFLIRWQDVLEQDYILVKIDIDRMTHMKEARSQIDVHRKDYRMIPWYVILSPTGEKLITSTGPKGSIGFPSRQPGIDHFMKMFRQTSAHISQKQLNAIEETLITNEEAK